MRSVFVGASRDHMHWWCSATPLYPPPSLAPSRARQVQAGRAEMRTRVMEENLQLAASQSASKSFLTSQVYKNSVDPSFFDQFGKTSR